MEAQNPGAWPKNYLLYWLSHFDQK